MINGTNYDWEDLDVHLNGILSSHVVDINYSDGIEREHAFGAGSKPVAIVSGNMEASGDITLRREGYDILNNACKAAGQSVYNIKPFLIVATYGSKTISDDSDYIEVGKSLLHTDTLMNVMFKKRDFGIKQNDKNNTVKLEVIFEPPVR